MTHGKVKRAARAQQEGEVDLLGESVIAVIEQEREINLSTRLPSFHNENC